MTAQPVESGAARMWTPDPVRQRRADYTLEDLLALPDDAPRVELRDGVMIAVPSPRSTRPSRFSSSGVCGRPFEIHLSIGDITP